MFMDWYVVGLIKMQKIENVSVFDLDGTLWKKNSHLEVLNCYFCTHFYTSLIARFLSRFFPVLWQNKIDKKLKEIPENFISMFDIKKLDINRDILNLLEEKRKKSKIVLMSNAPKEIVKNAGKYFNAETLCSGIGEKASVLKKNYVFDNLFVCTDNKSDSDLLEIADESLFINKKKMKSVFYVPMIYSLKTRYKGVLGLVSFFITSILPLVTYFYVFNIEENIVKNFISLCISYLIINIIYEIGYIINDVYSAGMEKNPTARLQENELKFCRTNILRIINARLIVITLLVIILVSLENFPSLFSISCLLLSVFYLFHNSISEKYRFVSNFVLVTLRFMSPFLLFCAYQKWNILLILFLSLPMLKTITYILKKSFHKKEFFLDRFQIIYYLVLFVFIFVIFYKTADKNIMICESFILFLFLYRFCIKIYRTMKNRTKKQEI